MWSLFASFAFGYMVIALLRVLNLDRNNGFPGNWAGFGVAAAATLVVKGVFFSSLAMVLGGLGMMTASAWLPLRKKVSGFHTGYLFFGSLLVIEPVIFLPVFIIYYLSEQFKDKHTIAFSVAVVGASVWAYYREKPDIMIIYLLGFYLAYLSVKPFRRLNLKTIIKRTALVIIPILVFALLFLNRYFYQGFGMQQPYVLYSGPSTFPVVALTFDDGPHPVYTNAVLNILREKEVPATFFVVGRRADSYPQVVRRIIDEGHEVGNHTYNHANLFWVPRERIAHEIVEGQRAISEVTGQQPRYFRPPRGLFNQDVLDVAAEQKLTLVLWSVSSQDWLGRGWRDIVRDVKRQAKPGSIILFHDSGDLITSRGETRLNTVRALPIIIDHFKKEGYQFVTVTEMLILSGLVGEDEVVPPEIQY